LSPSSGLITYGDGGRNGVIETVSSRPDDLHLQMPSMKQRERDGNSTANRAAFQQSAHHLLHPSMPLAPAALRKSRCCAPSPRKVEGIEQEAAERPRAVACKSTPDGSEGGGCLGTAREKGRIIRRWGLPRFGCTEAAMEVPVARICNVDALRPPH
jgi:hypothetical protein